MNVLKFYKQALAILLISILFAGCSSKSKNNNESGSNNPATEQETAAQENDLEASEVGFGGADQNVTEGQPFTVTASKPSTLEGEITYEWSENDTVLATEAEYTGTLDKGEHILTVKATDASGKTKSDTVSIKIGKYVISRACTDEDGDGIIDTVRVYTYNENGKLVSIEVYTNVNGEEEPEKNGMTPSETVTYSYDENGNQIGMTIKDKDGNVVDPNPNNDTESTNETPTKATQTNTLVDGTGNIITTDAKGTKRTFTYENGILVSGKAEYTNGTTKEYTYGYDEVGNWIKETVIYKDAEGNITDTETITYDDKGNVVKVEHDKDGDGIADTATSTKYKYLFIWKY
jgi:hypothetical protein